MLTTEDWIARGALAEAEGACRWPDDWVAVAAAWLAAGDPAQARRVIALALDRAGGEHWPTRRAAELLLTKLQDREGAAAALARIASRLREPGTSVRASDWTRLARAHRELFADEAAVQACLAEAATMATRADDLADLAEGQVALLGDRAAARATLERAVEVARRTGTLRELWGVANRWKHDLEDPARGRQTLQLAVAESTDIRDLTAFATAWRSLFADDGEVRATLLRAEQRAASAHDWLEVAEAYFDGGTDNRTTAWDAGGVQRALAASLAAGPTDEERTAIATGYRDWLGTELEPAGLPPAMHAPELVLPRLRTVAGDAAAPRALLDTLRARLTPARLEGIAKADYGHAWTKHHRVLVEIHATGLVPTTLTWHPLETLELYRWQQGADTDHELRAFACTVLALDAVGPACRQGSDIGNVLAPLVESAWAIGLDEPLEGLLHWLAEVAGEQELPWPLFGLVLTRARRAPDAPQLAGWVADLREAEAACRQAWNAAPGAPWLFRTSDFDAYHRLWRALATEVLADPRAGAPHLVELARLVGESG